MKAYTVSSLLQRLLKEPLQALGPEGGPAGLHLTDADPSQVCPKPPPLLHSASRSCAITRLRARIIPAHPSGAHTHEASRGSPCRSSAAHLLRDCSAGRSSRRPWLPPLSGQLRLFTILHNLPGSGSIRSRGIL